jgi:hypothetical protein
MRTRSWRLFALTLLALGQLSCAAGSLTPIQEPMPAARAGLLPEYRLFYDALQDYGDWIVIEPFGYVFRPREDMVNWRPYADGFWAPSDAYGWVWISSEAFGWATYHYGNWIYDHYQGWVWTPGLDWGPAWVSWEQTPDYIGWSPQFPTGYRGSVPGGSYLYVPTAQLAATDLKAHILTGSAVAEKLASPEVVRNMDQREGVRFNRGPSIGAIERLTGPLARVKVEDLAAPGDLVARPGSKPESKPAETPPKPQEVRRPEATPAQAPESRSTIERVRQAAEEQAQEARSASENKAPPPTRIQIFRLSKQRAEKAPEGKTRHGGKGKTAPADSTR